MPAYHICDWRLKNACVTCSKQFCESIPAIVATVPVLLERMVQGYAPTSSPGCIQAVPVLAEVVGVREDAHEAHQAVELRHTILHPREQCVRLGS
jgi:hypothetical protein